MINVELAEQNGATVFRASGRLTFVSAPQFRELVREAVNSGIRRIVVDLHDTTSMDSAGLAALVAGLKMTRRAGGDLRIAGANLRVSTTLTLTKLDRLLWPYGSVEDALHDWCGHAN